MRESNQFCLSWAASATFSLTFTLFLGSVVFFRGRGVEEFVVQKGFRVDKKGFKGLMTSLEKRVFMNLGFRDCRFCGLIWRVSMRLNGLRARNLWRKRKRQGSSNVKGSLLDPPFFQHSPDLSLEARVYLVQRLDCNCSFICDGSDGEKIGRAHV